MTLLGYIALLVISFLPPIIYAIWIRNSERYEREPWGAVFISFAWGATIAIIASLVLEMVFSIPVYSSFGQVSSAFILAVIVAPFSEELTKPLILSFGVVKKEINELEDGLIYGAAAGLGFSATENLFYSVGFLNYGIAMFILLVAIRTIGGCLLHASATAMTGYGYSKYIMGGKNGVVGYFIIAMLMHSTYNFIVSINIWGAFTSVVIAIIFAIAAIKYVRNKIKELDANKSFIDE